MKRHLIRYVVINFFHFLWWILIATFCSFFNSVIVTTKPTGTTTKSQNLHSSSIFLGKNFVSILTMMQGRLSYSCVWLTSKRKEQTYTWYFTCLFFLKLSSLCVSLTRNGETEGSCEILHVSKTMSKTSNVLKILKEKQL